MVNRDVRRTTFERQARDRRGIIPNLKIHDVLAEARASQSKERRRLDWPTDRGREVDIQILRRITEECVQPAPVMEEFARGQALALTVSGVVSVVVWQTEEGEILDGTVRRIAIDMRKLSLFFA